MSTIEIRATSCENRICANAKTKAQISCAVTAQLISAFVFATQIVHYIQSFKLLAIFCDCIAWFVSDLVGNPNCWFSHAQAHILKTKLFLLAVRLFSVVLLVCLFVCLFVCLS